MLDKRIDCDSNLKSFMAYAGILQSHQNNSPIVLGREEVIT